MAQLESASTADSWWSTSRVTTLLRLRDALFPGLLEDSPAQARSRERYRRALLAGLTSAAARTVSVVAGLISIPITLRYLGTERFGLWMTITSLTALLAFADFGLGNGLLNAIARCEARDDHHGLRAYVSSALAVLCCIGLVGIALAIFVAPHVDWIGVLAVDPNRVQRAEVNNAVVVLVVCLAVGIPATVVQKAQLGLQLGYLASLWQLAASVGGLVALLAAVKLHASLAWLVAALLATPSVIGALNSLVFWVYQRPESRPAPSLVKPAYARELIGSGFLFFVIQIGAAVAFASDNIIIAHVMGPLSVAQYSVASRIFDGVVMVASLFINPLWPAYTEAYTRHDAQWIRRTLGWSLATSAMATAFIGLLLIWFGRQLVAMWVGNALPYSIGLFAACALWATIRATGNALAIFLNGLGWIGMQAAIALVFAATAIAAKIVLGQKLGIIGIPIALTAAYLLTVALPYIGHTPGLLSKLDSFTRPGDAGK